MTFGICESQMRLEGKFGQNSELLEVSHGLNRDLWQGECVTPNSDTAVQSAEWEMEMPPAAQCATATQWHPIATV